MASFVLMRHQTLKQYDGYHLHPQNLINSFASKPLSHKTTQNPLMYYLGTWTLRVRHGQIDPNLYPKPCGKVCFAVDLLEPSIPRSLKPKP